MFNDPPPAMKRRPYAWQTVGDEAPPASVPSGQAALIAEMKRGRTQSFWCMGVTNVLLVVILVFSVITAIETSNKMDHVVDNMYSTADTMASALGVNMTALTDPAGNGTAVPLLATLDSTLGNVTAVAQRTLETDVMGRAVLTMDAARLFVAPEGAASSMMRNATALLDEVETGNGTDAALALVQSASRLLDSVRRAQLVGGASQVLDDLGEADLGKMLSDAERTLATFEEALDHAMQGGLTLTMRGEQ